MKIYTTHYNCNKPSNIQVNVPNYSDAKIGIDVEKNGEKIELGINDVTLVDGENTISADGEYNGYVTFPISTGDCGDDKSYNVNVNQVTVFDERIELTASTMKSVQDFIPLSDNVGLELKATSVTPISCMYGVDSQGRVKLSWNAINIVDSTKTITKYTWLYEASDSYPEPIGWYSGMGTQSLKKHDSIKIEDGDYLYVKSYCSNGSPFIAQIHQEESFGANFNLNVNSTKSSVFEPDVDENSVKDIMSKDTVVLSGTYADDTTFNFTIPVIK